ncbi:MAG: hypothetical protein ACREO1_04685 [Arenimonas sp.]
MRNSSQKMFFAAMAVVCMGLAQSVFASDVITTSSKVAYLNDQVGTPAMREQCTWDSKMAGAIIEQSKGTIVSTDQDIDKVTGKKLKIYVTDIHATGGGRFSGPKWMNVRGELTEGGKLIGNFKFFRSTVGGRLETCKTLDYISKAITKDVINWLKNPSIMPATEAAETKAPEAAK